MTPRPVDYAAVVLSNIEVTDGGCWRFLGYVVPSGYGQVGRNHGAHRVVWEHMRGSITGGLVLDHECHNRDETCPGGSTCLHRRCVNPDHLALVTRTRNALSSSRAVAAVNSAKDACPEGHEYTAENTYKRPDRPGRLCRACRTEQADRFFTEHQTYRSDWYDEHRELYRAYGREYRLHQRLGLPTKGLFTQVRRELEAAS